MLYVSRCRILITRLEYRVRYYCSRYENREVPAVDQDIGKAKQSVLVCSYQILKGSKLFISLQILDNLLELLMLPLHYQVSEDVIEHLVPTAQCLISPILINHRGILRGHLLAIQINLVIEVLCLLLTAVITLATFLLLEVAVIP